MENGANASQGSPSEASTPRRRTVHGTAASAWGLPVYLVGLALLYIGERLVGGDGSSRWLFSGAGLTAATAATGFRLASSSAAPAARRRLERWLGLLSLLGLVSIGLYFAGAEWLFPKWESAAGTAEEAQHTVGLWTSAWVILLGLSVIPLVFGETALFPMRQSARPELGRARTALTAGTVLALAASYAVLAVYAVAEQDWKADYSYFKTSRPGESTRNIAQSLAQPIKVYAFFPAVNEVRTEVLSYFRELSKISGGKLQVESHDRLLSPKFSRQFRVSRDGTIVLVKGESEVSFFVGSEMEEARPKLKTLDETVQKNLLKVARSSRVAYLTVGHGELNDRAGDKRGEENSATIAKQILDALGYKAKDLGLTEGLGREIPSDATVVIVLGPSAPFAPEELASLERYSASGGKLLLAVDPSRVDAGESLLGLGAEPAPSEAGNLDDSPSGAAQPSNEVAAATPAPVAASATAAGTRAGDGDAQGVASTETSARSEFFQTLSRLAAIGHVQLDPALLASESNHMQRGFNRSDRVLLVTNRFSSHASVSTLSRSSSRGAAVGIFGAGSLQAIPGAKGPKPDFSIKTMPDAFRDMNGDFSKSPGESVATFNVAAAITVALESASKKSATKNEEPGSKGKAESAAGPDEGRVFVIADADGFSDFVLGRARAQQYLLADVIRWLGGEESFSGAVSSEKDVPIEHTRDQDVAWFYSTIFGVPVLVLVLGLMGSRRRRRGGKR